MIIKLFGGFASEPLDPHPHYYGNGECFMFRLEPRRAIIPWSRLNNYFLVSGLDFFGFGGGTEGKFGLWLDSDFNHGSSHPCDTYMNPTLSKEPDFICKGVEIWGFSDFKPS